ncbi:hypothetical protein HMPREF1555_00237, partial [Porphyromonas gingivalis F0570]
CQCFLRDDYIDRILSHKSFPAAMPVRSDREITAFSQPRSIRIFAWPYSILSVSGKRL